MAINIRLRIRAGLRGCKSQLPHNPLAAQLADRRAACELLRFDQSERRWTALLLAATVRLAAALAVVSGRGLAERAWPWAHVWQVAGLVVADLRGGGGGAHLVPVQNA